MRCTSKKRDLIISGPCMAQASRGGIKVLDYNLVQGLSPYMKGRSQESIGGYLRRI